MANGRTSPAAEEIITSNLATLAERSGGDGLGRQIGAITVKPPCSPRPRAYRPRVRAVVAGAAAALDGTSSRCSRWPRWPRSEPLPRRDAFYFSSRLRLRGDECTKKASG